MFKNKCLTLHSQNGNKYCLAIDKRVNNKKIGEMAEWSIAAVLKTVEVRASGGSNPSLSAEKGVNQVVTRFTPFFTSKNRGWVYFF